jgi:hypothetical protein
MSGREKRTPVISEKERGCRDCGVSSFFAEKRTETNNFAHGADEIVHPQADLFEEVAALPRAVQ